jgi:hypothetical protein
MRYIGIAVMPIIALALLFLRPLNVYLLGLVFMGFAGLVIFIAYRSIHSGGGQNEIDQQSRQKNLSGYSLYCRNCGYTWEMRVEEWKTAGQRERENIINSASRFPSSQNNLNESVEGIEWKPPNPNRGIFIVGGFIGLSLIVSLLLYGIFWAKTHQGNSYAIVVNGISAVLAFFIYAGLMAVFKPKANRVVFTLLISVALIGLALVIFTFLVK